MASDWTLETLRALMDRELLSVRQEIIAERRLVEQHFTGVDKALVLKAEELARRLDVLNHVHELAREKERDFIGRDAFETFTQRTTDDFLAIRREIQSASTQASVVREGAAHALSAALSDQIKRVETRFANVESLQAKMLGGLLLAMFIVPLIMGGVYYLLTKSG